MRRLLAGVLLVTVLGCGRSSSPRTLPGAGDDSGTTAPLDAAVDAGLDASADGPSCFVDPQTYLEI
ncbi:MAG TPA: hypothetical protein VHS09_01035, partial [Polyangiaceae bacterium]|nr:hypothetical protein [Polyangiaceae bacterium]